MNKVLAILCCQIHVGSTVGVKCYIDMLKCFECLYEQMNKTCNNIAQFNPLVSSDEVLYAVPVFM
jgi:hypothetical protein